MLSHSVISLYSKVRFPPYCSALPPRLEILLYYPYFTVFFCSCLLICFPSNTSLYFSFFRDNEEVALCYFRSGYTPKQLGSRTVCTKKKESWFQSPWPFHFSSTNLFYTYFTLTYINQNNSEPHLWMCIFQALKIDIITAWNVK